MAHNSTVVTVPAEAVPTCYSCPDLIAAATSATVRSHPSRQERGIYRCLVQCVGTDCTYQVRWRSLLLEALVTAAIIASHSFASPIQGNPLTEHSEVGAAP